MLLIYFKIWFLAFAGYLNSGQPTFKGGTDALNSFIASKMIYPNFSKANCIQGTIYISFQLSENGQVFKSKVQKGLGIDLDDEALRLIRLTSGKWEIPTPYDKNSKIIIPVNFSLKNFDCNERNPDGIKKAIDYYQSRAALEQTVQSYYKNKEEGKKTEISDYEISELKTDLGFDDAFIADKLKEAKKRLKQGDKEGACETLRFVRYIGSNAADEMIAENCK